MRVTERYCGTTYNAMPDEAMLNGTIRTVSKDFTDPSMASEDFSQYLEKIPGSFFFMGNANHGAIHSTNY